MSGYKSIAGGVGFPSVYQSHEGGMALVVEATVRQVTFIAISGNPASWDTQHARGTEFLNSYKPANYSVAQFAQKALNGLIPPTQRVEQILKELIMENATVIAVNKDASFAGRFADAATAAKAAPEATLVTSAAEMAEAGFTKAQLTAQLTTPVEGTKAELAEALFAQYVAAEATVVTKKKGRKASGEPKAPKEPKEPRVTIKSLVREALKTAPHSVAQLIAIGAEKLADFPTEAEAQLAKVMTPIGNLRAELELVSFTTTTGEGEAAVTTRYYVAKAIATPEQLAKPEPKPKAAKKAAEAPAESAEATA